MRTKRVGWRLLALLWIWAATVFLVVDLFLDAPGLDPVRPRAPVYRAMRMTAHEMVGEPYRDDAQTLAIAKKGGRGGPEAEPGPAAVLERLRFDRPAAWAPELAGLRGHVPPELMGKYAEAAAAAAAELATSGEVVPDEAKALAAAAIEAQAQSLLLPAPDWRSARVTIERIAWVLPDWEKAFDAELSAVRYAVAHGLAAGPDAEAVELAAVVGDQPIAGACLRLLPRDAARPRTRDEALVQEHAARAVARWGTDQDRIALAAWLERALAEETDAARRRTLARRIEDARVGP
jgi:hypothetical protein